MFGKSGFPNLYSHSYL